MLPAMKLGKYSSDIIEEKAIHHLRMLGIEDQALTKVLLQVGLKVGNFGRSLLSVAVSADGILWNL